MEYIAQAIKKTTGLFGTCTHCDTKEDAQKEAKYYRSIGYNARVYREDQYGAALEANSKLYYEQVNLMRQSGIR